MHNMPLSVILVALLCCFADATTQKEEIDRQTGWPAETRARVESYLFEYDVSLDGEECTTCFDSVFEDVDSHTPTGLLENADHVAKVIGDGTASRVAPLADMSYEQYIQYVRTVEKYYDQPPKPVQTSYIRLIKYQ